MEVTQVGLDLVKSFEGIEDGDPSTGMEEPYLCPAGYWTIGWGHVVRGPDGTMLHGPAMHDLAFSIYPNGLPLADCEVLLRNDLRKFEYAVNMLVGDAMTTEPQFDAMVALAFNIGAGPEGFAGSSVLRYHRGGLFSSPLSPEQAEQIVVRQRTRPNNAADAFLMWNKCQGQILNGLVRRRQAERALYLSGSA